MQKIICLLAISLLFNNVVAAGGPKVAVASNFSHAITEIADSYRADTGISPKLTFGSSGNFARQIIQGAPYKLFLSADKKYVDLLRKNDIKMRADIIYARGRIGLFVSKESELYKSNDLTSVIKNMYHGNFSRIVIANPEHAPYGLAAQQALQSAGLWVVEKQRLLMAENAAQATQIAISGNVDLGIIPASHAHLANIREKGNFFLIPETWHQSLQHHLVLLEGANESESQFFNYMQNEKTRLILKKYAYSLDPVNQQGLHYGLASP